MYLANDPFYITKGEKCSWLLQESEKGQQKHNIFLSVLHQRWGTYDSSGCWTLTPIKTGLHGQWSRTMGVWKATTSEGPQAPTSSYLANPPYRDQNMWRLSSWGPPLLWEIIVGIRPPHATSPHFLSATWGRCMCALTPTCKGPIRFT